MTTELPAYEYIAYFDEAGDPGIKRVVPIDPVGGSEWFALSCVVIRRENDGLAVDFIKRLRTEFNFTKHPDIHYKNLRPSQRLRSCEELAKEDVRIFVLLSNKQSMRGYRNPKAEARSQHPNDFFYNYCIRILLERVTEYLEIKSKKLFGGPRKAELIFSKRGGHSYRHVETYTRLLEIQKSNGSLYQSFSAPEFSIIDPAHIYAVQHEQNAGLQMADIAASAFYQAAHARAKSWDIKPAQALMPRVATVKNQHADKGVQLLPWRTWKNPLTEDQQKIFSFYGYKF